MQNYDVIVIGAGPGGYVAAIRCAQLGLSVACVESWSKENGKPALGGTCLNVGCIPSKALLESTHHYSYLKNDAADHGINISGASMDVNKMIARKDKTVHILTQGIAGLFRKNNIDLLHGRGRITAQDNSGHYLVEVSPSSTEDEETITASGKHIIIATGSEPSKIPPAKVDNDRIVDSTGALAFNETPRKLCIIGAGVIGLELGSVWNRLGSEVVILEALETFLGPVDDQLSDEAYKILSKQGLDIRLGAKVTGTGSNNQEVIVIYEDSEGKQQISVDKLIVGPWMKGDLLWLMANARPICRMSMPSAMLSEGLCWPTRHRKKAWLWPNALLGNLAISIIKPFPGLFTPGQRLPGSV